MGIYLDRMEIFWADLFPRDQLDIKCIQRLLLLHELFWIPKLKHWTFLQPWDKDFSKAKSDCPICSLQMSIQWVLYNQKPHSKFSELLFRGVR